jgi:hypothetical protein
VFPGEEVVPGVILKKIEGDRVILLTSGIEKELKLRESSASPAASSLQTFPKPSSQPTRAQEQ